jgi:hypothetical protein
MPICRPLVHLSSGFRKRPIVRCIMMANGLLKGQMGYGAKAIASPPLSTHNLSWRVAFTATVNKTPLLQDSLSVMPRMPGSGGPSFALAPQSYENLSKS